uniref:Adenosine deaminase RNA specific B2 (inactive) n=1 Tax=Labrus bergylta TaxID=56723 RepID=A0A3Q3G7C7_9LABR
MTRRLAPVKHLPFPYRRQQLLLGCSRDVRPAGKTPNVSVNWSCGDEALEEISTSTGRKRDSGTPSRLCRRSMFTRWQRLQQQVGWRLLSRTPLPQATSRTYSGSKMAAGQYQRAMQQFNSALQSGGLGTWLRKPQELCNFDNRA